MAMDYQHGNSIAQDLPKAIELYSKAVEMGNPQAQLSLGYCYLDGEGVPTNRAKAMELFQAAANQGLPAAQKALLQ